MTHPQSPASPLPEAAEPVALGAADLSAQHTDTDKHRAFEWLRALATSPNAPKEAGVAFDTWAGLAAQAPAQAGEVAVASVRIKTWPTGKEYGLEGLEAILSLPDGGHLLYATQPPAAPVQQEAEAVTLLDSVEVARKWEAFRISEEGQRAVGWLGGPSPDAHGALFVAFRAGLYATPPAHPVLAPVVREPLSDEQIHDLLPHASMTPQPFADLLEFARAIERAHGIQATTGEQSHG